MTTTAPSRLSQLWHNLLKYVLKFGVVGLLGRAPGAPHHQHEGHGGEERAPAPARGDHPRRSITVGRRVPREHLVAPPLGTLDVEVLQRGLVHEIAPALHADGAEAVAVDLPRFDAGENGTERGAVIRRGVPVRRLGDRPPGRVGGARRGGLQRGAGAPGAFPSSGDGRAAATA